MSPKLTSNMKWPFFYQKVDFDKTKHLSDSSIRRRRIERDRLMAKEREREERERQAAEQEKAKKEAERYIVYKTHCLSFYKSKFCVHFGKKSVPYY